MGTFGAHQWPLIMVTSLVMQIQPVRVQGVDPGSQKLRRLNEQFQQFRALTQARLNMLALNQNRNSSKRLESRVQALNDHYKSLSQDLAQLKQTTAEEIEGLREWSRKLEKKSKRLEARLALMERNLRENRRQAQRQKPDVGQEVSILSLELQNQEERLAALQVQRDELVVGLKGLRESLKNQELRVTRVEGRLGGVQQWNRGSNTQEVVKVGEPADPLFTPMEYYEAHRRSQTQRRRRPGRVLERYTPPSPASVGDPQQNRYPPQTYQHHGTPNQPKPSKTQKTFTQPFERANPTLPSSDHPSLPEPDLSHHQTHIHVRANTRPYTFKRFPQNVPQVQQPSHSYTQKPSSNPDRPSLHRPDESQRRSQPLDEGRSQAGPGTPRPQSSDGLPQARSESFQHRWSEWEGGPEEESRTGGESTVIHGFLQLPLRQKIPSRRVPKKDATICNVDSVLIFPLASVENYVTFSQSLPDLPELSVCLWLRVDASHVGTLFSYATHDNDNQLVLYGRNSSALSSSASSSSSPSLDFVLGDPVYRRLPVPSLLDNNHWHHLCILWSSIQGHFWHYYDRRLASSGSSFRKGWEVPGGGSMVLGQEQDTVGGGFDPAEGFAGQIAGFRVWNRVLSPTEVEGLADGRGIPRGGVLDMEDIKEVHGDVQQVACECLEHCV